MSRENVEVTRATRRSCDTAERQGRQPSEGSGTSGTGRKRGVFVARPTAEQRSALERRSARRTEAASALARLSRDACGAWHGAFPGRPRPAGIPGAGDRPAVRADREPGHDEADQGHAALRPQASRGRLPGGVVLRPPRAPVGAHPGSRLRALLGGVWVRGGPPNAALTLLHAGDRQDTVVVALGRPHFRKKKNTIRYSARILDEATGNLSHLESDRDPRVRRRFRAPSLFIDDATGRWSAAACPTPDALGPT